MNVDLVCQMLQNAFAELDMLHALSYQVMSRRNEESKALQMPEGQGQPNAPFMKKRLKFSIAEK